jgi:hypothetical protein
MKPRPRAGGLPAMLLGLVLLGSAAGCGPAGSDGLDREAPPPIDPTEDPIGDPPTDPANPYAAPAPADPPPGPATLAPAYVEPATLAAVASEPVVGRTGPGGQPFEVAVRTPKRAGHDRLFGRQTFPIALRDAESTADYPCSSCHRPGRPVIRPERIEDAHRNVLPRHPDESGSHCITCHAPDDVERLVLASGERIPLGHAYRLCAQCHYSQVDAWAAGAHGKRLDGWRGRRVVMGCADCHDPHQPGLEPRIPFPGPTLPRTGRRTP